MGSATSSRHKIILAGNPTRCDMYSEFIRDLKRYYQVIPLMELNRSFTNFSHATCLLLGGDGTFNHFINHLTREQLQHEPTIVSFPCGTANDLARSLKLSLVPADLSRFISIVENAPKVRIPLMQCNDHFFINCITAGMPGKVTSSGENLGKKILGRFNYYLEAMDQFIKKESYNIELRQNGVEALKLQTLGFVIAQGMYAGGAMKITSGYTPYFQENFEFLTIMANQIGPTVKATLEIQKLDPNLEGIPLISRIGREMMVICDREMPAKLDGEEYSASAFLIRKSEFAVNIYLH